MDVITRLFICFGSDDSSDSDNAGFGGVVVIIVTVVGVAVFVIIVQCPLLLLLEIPYLISKRKVKYNKISDARSAHWIRQTSDEINWHIDANVRLCSCSISNFPEWKKERAISVCELNSLLLILVGVVRASERARARSCVCNNKLIRLTLFVIQIASYLESDVNYYFHGILPVLCQRVSHSTPIII